MPDTQDTVPRARVVRFEVKESGEWAACSVGDFSVAENVRAIVAIPMKCETCEGSGEIDGFDADGIEHTGDCPYCDGTGYERCPTCEGSRVRQVPDDGTYHAEGLACDCIDGVLHDEHEVGVRDAIEHAAGCVGQSGHEYDVEIAAVLAALIGQGSET